MGVELSTIHSVIGALVIALLLAALHIAAPRIRKLPLVPEGAMGSFAGGLAVAYVFLHLLPEIAEGNEVVGEMLADVLEPTPLLELGIFLVALAGFTLFYGLERLAENRGSPRGRRTAAVSAADGSGEATSAGVRHTGTALTARTPRVGDADGETQPPPAIYWLHLSSFMLYNGLITYTMSLRLRTGLVFAVLFTVAMGLHFVLTDRGLEEHYPRRFAHRGRLLLAAALLVGWVLSAVLAPTSTLVVSVLTALLGGSILLNVFKEELPSGRGSSFPWFMVGLTVYAGLLALVTALGAE